MPTVADRRVFPLSLLIPNLDSLSGSLTHPDDRIGQALSSLLITEEEPGSESLGDLS